ncbi:hypothetical protein Gasu2_02690 [Galdieria sulphuraria]|nr:hypothetical protein Gasu2_02690 [Galdieria sulphuraria]
MDSNNLMGSDNKARHTNKPKYDSKGELAAKLASLPYSFSQTLPSVTRKKSNSYFDRNFPQLDSGKSASKGHLMVAEERNNEKHTVVKETQERGQGVMGPTVAEIVAGVAHTSKPESHMENEDKEELKEAYSMEQVEKTLYSRLVPATNSSKNIPRRLGTSMTSHSSSATVTNSNYPRKKQTLSPLPRLSKKDTLETLEKSGGNTGTMRPYTLQQESSVDKKPVHVLQVDNESRKKSWNVLKSNKMNRSHSANAVYEDMKDSLQGHWNRTEDIVENKKQLSIDNEGDNLSQVESFVDNEEVHSNEKSSENTASWKTVEKQLHNSNDDYDKFESLLRSMGWNPENGEHGEEITEEEKAQWLEMHSGISTSSGVWLQLMLCKRHICVGMVKVLRIQKRKLHLQNTKISLL